VPEGPIFLGISCLDHGRLDLSKAEHLTEADLGRWTRRVTPTANDVVFSYETRIGEAAKIPPGFRGCLGRRMGLLRPRATVDPDFLLYAFLGPDFQETLRSRTVHGSTVDRILLTELGDFPIRVPGLSEQRHIAAALKALDDKIDLNHRVSQTLESMARALFNSWFVDFDPVHSNSEGRDKGLTARLGDLFPVSFDHSELGSVPSEWVVCTLGDLCSRVAMGPFGSDITVDNFIDSGVPVVRGGNLKDGFLDGRFVYVSAAKADALRNANAFPGDVVITHRGTLGQVGQIPDQSRFPRYVVSQSQMLLSANRQRVAPQYIYYYLRSELGQQALLANTSQTGVPAIARPTTSLRAIRLLAPPAAVTWEFERLLRPSMDKRNTLASESLLLSEILGGLLPRMMARGVHVTADGRANAPGDAN
jgi:type I restriction enzyme S subunit